MHMECGIYLLRGNNTLLELRASQYESEDLLQGFLADHSSLLAGEQINPAVPRRWVRATTRKSPHRFSRITAASLL